MCKCMHVGLYRDGPSCSIVLPRDLCACALRCVCVCASKPLSCSCGVKSPTPPEQKGLYREAEPQQQGDDKSGMTLDGNATNTVGRGRLMHNGCFLTCRITKKCLRAPESWYIYTSARVKVRARHWDGDSVHGRGRTTFSISCS